MEDEYVPILTEIVAELEETVTERDLYKKMLIDERKAKDALAKELEAALIKIQRLNFYLENS